MAVCPISRYPRKTCRTTITGCYFLLSELLHRMDQGEHLISASPLDHFQDWQLGPHIPLVILSNRTHSRSILQVQQAVQRISALLALVLGQLVSAILFLLTELRSKNLRLVMKQFSIRSFHQLIFGAELVVRQTQRHYFFFRFTAGYGPERVSDANQPTGAPR